jgi:hypothetical protein
MFQNTHHIHIYDTELISIPPAGHPLHPAPIPRNFPKRAVEPVETSLLTSRIREDLRGVEEEVSRLLYR